MRFLTIAALTMVLMATAACDSMYRGENYTAVRDTGGREVAVSTQRSVTIRRGEQAALTVDVDRERYSGPVTVSISGLPTGVRADDKMMKVETAQATFILEASRDAVIVRGAPATVRIEGPGGMAATQYVDITVEP
jgi:hypothetical protein